MEKHADEATERRRKRQDVWELEENTDAQASRMGRNRQQAQGSTNPSQV